MATVDELKAELVSLNTVTDELAADVADLISKLGDPAALDEVRAGMVALRDRLSGLASQHTPST